MPVTGTMLDAALTYAARGWAIFPLHTVTPNGACTCRDGDECTNTAKHPRTRHGLNDATTDPTIIRDWWARWPDTNIAIATGAISGIHVVDIDPAHGGETTLDQLVEQHGPLPTTLTALTGGDGMHLVYTVPTTIALRNTASRVGVGIDTRGDGGYIVAAPSLHASGQRYEWLDPTATVAELPDWIVELVARHPEPAPAPPRPASPVPAAPGTTTKYAQVALEARTAEVATAPQGRRNHTLNEAAFRLGQLVAGGQIDEQAVVDALTDAAGRAGLGPTETAATIRSGLAAGATSPQYPDPGRASSPTSSSDAVSPSGPTVAAQPEGARPTPVRAGTADASPPAADDAPPAPPQREVVDDDDDPDGEINDTDLGNARRLIRNHGHELRYSRARGAWLRWDGTRWATDDDGYIGRCAHATAQSIVTEIPALDDADERKKRFAWAIRSEAHPRLEALVRRAEHLRGVTVTADELDADPWRLNVANGTIDLRTGELHPHRPDDLITKLAPVAYRPDAHDPRWDAYLHSALGGDTELADWLQRAVGYTLTGDTSEEVLFFAHGPTQAGKSTFLEAIKAMLGDYARMADFETFLARDHASTARSDIARLAGARLVTSNEVDEGRRLAEGLIKTLTGGDTITARYLYRDEFEFRPQFKLWLAANHKPKVRHTDDAIWRRIRLVPFVHPPDQPDPTLKQHLTRDPDARSAILAWAIEGCRRWQAEGLRTAGAVRAATDAYRAEMDPLAEFFADRCSFGHDPNTYWVASADLRKAYEAWAADEGIKHTLSPNVLRELLEERNCHPDRRRIDGRQVRVWIGLRLLTDFETPDELPGLGVAPVTTGQTDNRVRQARRLDATSNDSPIRAGAGRDFPETAVLATRASHPPERPADTAPSLPLNSSPDAGGSVSEIADPHVHPGPDGRVECARGCGRRTVPAPEAAVQGWRTVCGECTREDLEGPW